MNKKTTTVFMLILAGAFLFNGLFWQELVAINALLFDLFIVGSLFYVYPSAKDKSIVKYLLAAHAFCIVMVIFNNTPVSKLAMSVTLLLLVAFAEYSHRSAWYAGGAIVLNFTFFITGFSSIVRSLRTKQPRKQNMGKLLRFAVFPVFIVAVFFIIYNSANTVFAGIVGKAAIQLEKFFNHFFEWIALDRILFLLTGIYLTGSLLLRPQINKFETIEAAHKDDLLRQKKAGGLHKKGLLHNIINSLMGKLAKGNLALRNEYTVGLISLVLLNALLLIINAIDIDYLWFNFSYTPGMNLKDMIHEGTELLILSLVLAMVVLLFFFRGNLNFYQKNKWLKTGAYAWIIQNSILVISVLIRDYYYIKLTGLAYKRIGVLIFLVLVLTGLVTTFIKITWKKTTYYLLRVNAWAAVVLFVITTTIDWDMLIAKYNIGHSDTIKVDVPFLLSLSDRTLPLLDANMPLLKQREAELNSHDTYLARCSNCVEKIIQDRKNNYMQEQQAYSWLSWNYTDAVTKKYFKNKTALVAGNR